MTHRRNVFLVSLSLVTALGAAGALGGACAGPTSTTLAGAGGSTGSTTTSSAVSTTGGTTTGTGGTAAGGGGAGGATAGTGGMVADGGGTGATTTTGTGGTAAGTGGMAADGGGTGGAPVLVYDEELATVLRAVQIDAAAASQLGVQPGYYAITAWRVSGQPSETAVAIEIEKGYAACVNPGNSLLPLSTDPWVFFDATSYTYNATEYQQTASDAHGHVLSFDILFGSTCETVSYSTLDGASVGLSTETYTTGVLDTCGWTTEPAITGPAISCM